ncbi:MAG: helix-turn-helix transcriptional regulator [Firmicutes bacterium]|nr:helix-turn-helix transcriptional regulator [Bacillota bacterium]
MKEKKDINIEIGKRIQRARQSAGLTQEEFAELIQMGPKNVSAIERGVTGISTTTISRICKSLSISADLLFSDVPDNSEDINILINRLKQLTPEQYKIANDMFNILLTAFSLDESKH